MASRSVVYWTSGKSVGFIPKSTFHYDSSGNPDIEREVLFFQDFGVGDPQPKSEGCPYDITWADIYDVSNMLGPWWNRPDIPMANGKYHTIGDVIAFLRSHGYGALAL